MTHRHDVFAGERLVEAARQAFIDRGEQWTDLRATVLDSLAQASGPLSAYAVADLVSAAVGRRIAANSIYRILDLFVAFNLALRIESRNAYVVNVHPGCVHDCLFLVCERCGAASHLDDEGTARSVRTLAGHRGFAVRRPVLEVLGLCASCQGASTA